MDQWFVICPSNKQENRQRQKPYTSNAKQTNIPLTESFSTDPTLVFADPTLVYVWGLMLDVFNGFVEILRSVVILYTTGRRLHTDESSKPVVTGVEEDDDRCVYSE